eukprot:CAMPEP_0194533526 /NCGR_PEP_ID=MMETSP0253-20130528/71430_1 /TAXON_ID=2966 /ORGANISM="Noctiluca scintillans" /LENGTH=143 /DNA_ID=CAMNT_0039379089 /DNA_START=132 /DNA_END=560 /DNA_ORIENTATION=+
MAHDNSPAATSSEFSGLTRKHTLMRSSPGSKRLALERTRVNESGLQLPTPLVFSSVALGDGEKGGVRSGDLSGSSFRRRVSESALSKRWPNSSHRRRTSSRGVGGPEAWRGFRSVTAGPERRGFGLLLPLRSRAGHVAFRGSP